jgi:hypothetical protein
MRRPRCQRSRTVDGRQRVAVPGRPHRPVSRRAISTLRKQGDARQTAAKGGTRDHASRTDNTPGPPGLANHPASQAQTAEPAKPQLSQPPSHRRPPLPYKPQQPPRPSRRPQPPPAHRRQVFHDDDHAVRVLTKILRQEGKRGKAGRKPRPFPPCHSPRQTKKPYTTRVSGPRRVVRESCRASPLGLLWRGNLHCSSSLDTSTV